MTKNSLLALAFLEGGLVMLLETSSPLIVSPILGHSIIIWAAMISVSIGALALGYFLGGFLSRKSRPVSAVYKMFGVNALLLLLGWYLIHLQNFSDGSMATPMVSWLIVSVVLFFPLIIFGATTPILVSLFKEHMKGTTATVGKVYSISTVGGIFFSLLSGYYFIPELGISDTVLIGSLFTILLPCIFFLKSKATLFLFPSGLVGLAAIFLLSKSSTLPSSDDFNTLHYSESINGQLIVADFKMQNVENRILFINRMGQTWINKEKSFSVWPYVNYVTSAASLYPAGSKTLVLGLGGGIVPNQIRKFIGHHVDAVELDERIIELSKKYFNLRGVKTHAEDARRFVKKSTKKYDFILFDIFNGEILPSHGLSKEAFEDTKKILSKNGLIVINFNGFITGKEGLPGRALIKTLEAAGFKVKLFDTGAGKQEESDGNMLYFAYLEEPNWPSAKIHVTLPDGEYRIGEHLIDSKTIDFADAPIITDDLPIMEYINRHAAKSWRTDYLENFTIKFNKEHKIPLIK